MTRTAPFVAALAFALASAAGQDIAALVTQLGSADSNQRHQAYQELQRRRAPEMVPLLGKQLPGFPPHGQQLGIYLLQGQPIEQTRPVFQQLVAAEAPFLRVAAAAMLVRNGDAALVPTLVQALAAMPVAERSSALGMLWNINEPRVVAAIRGYLQPGANGGLVNTALQHLIRMEQGRSEATKAAVLPLAAATDSAVRAAALAFLVAGDASHAKALAQLLQDEPDRFWQIRQLLDGVDKLPTVLVPVIAHALANVRSRYEIGPTATLLQRQAPGEAASALRKLLLHTDAELRAGALEALVSIPGGLDQKQLRELLHGDAIEQRLVAADVLRRMDDPSGLPVVLELLPRAGQKKAEATRVLAKFRSRQVVPPLLDLLLDADLQVRNAAWNGLQEALRELLPYRRFAFDQCGYDSQKPDPVAVQRLRDFWAGVKGA